jgi:hypothetical protein
MPKLTYLRLPINADEGFPQSFQLNVSGRIYRVLLYVNVLEGEAATPDDHIYRLPELGAFMVMRVDRETAGTPQVIFQRKLVLNLEYEAAELAFLFRRIWVAKRNLNGVGAFGSEVNGGVAARWVL